MIGVSPSSGRPAAARATFGNSAASTAVHRNVTAEAYNLEQQGQNTLTKKSIAYGGFLGCCMSAAALGVSRALQLKKSSAAGAKAAGAVDRQSIVLMLAGALPSACSIGYVVWCAYETERTFMHRERLREEWELENFPEGEKSEMIELYVARGIDRQDAVVVVDIFAKRPSVLVDAMMVEELGFSRVPIPSFAQIMLKGAIPATVSAITCIVAPLLPIIFAVGGAQKGNQNLAVGEALLAAQVSGLSCMQGLLLYGEYWRTDHGTTKLVALNAAWIGLVYALSKALSGSQL
jgi:hypothetical protein